MATMVVFLEKIVSFVGLRTRIDFDTLCNSDVCGHCNKVLGAWLPQCGSTAEAQRTYILCTEYFSQYDDDYDLYVQTDLSLI